MSSLRHGKLVWPLRNVGTPWTWLAALLVAVQGGLLATSAVIHSPVVDEPAHMASGLAHWHLGRYEAYRVNPPLVRMVATLPVLAMRPATEWKRYQPHPTERFEFLLGSDFITANVGDFHRYFVAARWMLIPVVLLGGIVCYAWAKELGGQLAGIGALSLWCFNPEILTHGAYITPDASAATSGVIAAYACWKWLEIGSWSKAVSTGIAVGVALITKMTWLLLLAVIPATWLVWRVSAAGSIKAQRGTFAQLACILAGALAIVNIFYCLDGTMTPLGDYRFVSPSLSGRREASSPFHVDNIFHGTFVGRIPIPLPREYILGLDLQQKDFEAGNWSYLAGRWRPGGWWYYYLVGMAVKMPVGFWLLALLALCGVFVRRHPIAWHQQLAVLLPGLILVVAASLKTGMNQHFRYVLPAFPFLFVWIGCMVACMAKGAAEVKHTRMVTMSALCFLVIHACESLAVYPHSAGFFNVLAGGPHAGHKWLTHSATDWGQDLFILKRWYESHPAARPLYVAYYHIINPRIVGIDCDGPSIVREDGTIALSPPDANTFPPPGWYAVGVNNLVAHRRPFPYLDDARIVERVGASIAIVHIAPSTDGAALGKD